MRKGHKEVRHVEAFKPAVNRVPTSGEVFADGTIIEPVRACEGLQLLLWNGRKSTIGKRVQYDGRVFEPAAIDSAMLRAFRFPEKDSPCGSPRQLLNHVSKIVADYAGLAENYAAIVAHFVLATWLVDCLPTAPRLSVVGGDAIGGAQFLRLLHALCRHSIVLTDLSAGDTYSLPVQWQPTVLLRQPELNVRLQRVLASASTRDEYVLRNGHILDLFFPLATYTNEPYAKASTVPGIEISIASTGRLPILDEDVRQKIADEFQGKLLRYRLAELGSVRTCNFDAPELTSPVRQLARSLAACLPNDADLQAEIVKFLQDRDASIRCARSTGLEANVIETLLFFSHDLQLVSVHVAQIAEYVNTLLGGRNEVLRVDPRAIGNILRSLGLATRRLDAAGRGILLVNEIRERVHQLAWGYAVPTVREGKAPCDLCAQAAQAGQAEASGL